MRITAILPDELVKEVNKQGTERQDPGKTPGVQERLFRGGYPQAQPPEVTILDTSRWIAFLWRQAGIFEPARRILEDGQALAVECIFGELLKGARGELKIEAGRYTGVHRQLLAVLEPGMILTA